MVFYSGHGAGNTTGKQNYLLPTDYDFSPKFEGCPEVLDILKSIESSKKLLWIDACRSGKSHLNTFNVFKDDELYNEQAIMFSTTPGATANDNPQDTLGAFTNAAYKVMNEMLYTSDKKQLAVLQAEIKEVLQKDTRQTQIPVYHGSADFVFQWQKPHHPNELFDAGMKALEKGNAKMAEELLLKSFEKGHLKATSQLAFFYWTGNFGMPVNKPKAVVLYKIAYENGSAEAAYQMGIFHASQNGAPGVLHDNNQAIQYFRIALKRGYTSACSALDELGVRCN
jgi:TPR repeat protein